MLALQATQPFQRRAAWALAAVVVLTLLVRIPGVRRPFLGPFATKSIVHAMIARNWARHQAPWHLPTLDVLVGEQKGLHLLEYPIFTLLVAWGRVAVGGSWELWGRGSTVLWAALAGGFLYLGVRQRWGAEAAWGAGLAWAAAPVGIIYGQSFMVEVPAVACLLGGWWLWPQALRPGSSRIVRATVVLLTAAAWLGRPPLLAFLPVFVAEAFWTAPTRRQIALAVAALALSLVPLLLWLAWVWHITRAGHPLADRVYYSLFRAAQDHAAPWHWWTQARWHLQVGKELAWRLLGPWGIALAAWGMWKAARGQKRWGWTWLVCSVVLVALLPRKFGEQNYYYVLLLPAGCVLAGWGWAAVVSGLLQRRTLAWSWFGALWLAGGLAVAAPPAWSIPPEDRPVLHVAQLVQQHTRPGQKVVALQGGGISLLFYCDRPGWAWKAQSPRLTQRLHAARQRSARAIAWIDHGEPRPWVPEDYACLAQSFSRFETAWAVWIRWPFGPSAQAQGAQKIPFELSSPGLRSRRRNR